MHCANTNSEQKKPLVSVLMSVYSEVPDILKESIDSILSQSYSNFEFLIYLDKPDNEDLWQFLCHYAENDSRVIIRKNQKNRLLAGTLNDELHVARGEYMVRMDGDDISVKDRIECLVNFMECHPEVGVASSWMKAFGHKKWYQNRIVKYTSDFNEMKCMMLYQTPIAHAPCIIRRTVVDKYGPALYNERCCKTQDYELWSRLIDNGVIIGMVPKPLYLRRVSHGDGPEPINYRVIHNQVSRHNMKNVLSKVNIALPDVVGVDLASLIRKAIKESSGLLKKKLKIIQCVLYSNVFNNPIERLFVMLVNGDISCLFALPIRMRMHLFRSGKLTEMNNLVTSPNQLIYA